MVYIVTILLAGLAGISQGITGFGSGMIIMSVLPYFLGITNAAAVSGLVMLLLNIVGTWHFRHKLNFRHILGPTICFFIGSAVAITNVQKVPVKQLQLVFGCFLIGLSLYFILIKRGGTIKANVFTMLLCGLGAGVCDGLFSIGGPPLAVYYLAVAEDNEEYLADQQSCYLIADIFTVALRIHEGILTPHLFMTGLIGIFGVLAGMGIAFKLLQKFDPDVTRKLVYGMMGVSGTVTLIKTLLAF